MSKHKDDRVINRGDGATHAADDSGSAADGTTAKGEVESAKAEPDTAAKAMEAALESAESELKATKEELALVNDKYLRKLAEEVNFRKRMMREKDEALKYGISGLLTDIIPVLDDFDRAIASADSSRSFDQLHDGIVLIRRQLGQMLETRYCLKRIASTGAPFDPNMHEAVAAENADVDESVVGEEFLPGYQLHDRVLRTAKVRVRMPAPGKSPSEGEMPAADSGASEEGAEH